LSRVGDRRLYFVHSFRATPTPQNHDWVLATTSYGRDFVSVVEKGSISATQFHPEKSGGAGLDVLKSFLEAGSPSETMYRSPNSNGETGTPSVDCDVCNATTIIAPPLGRFKALIV